MPLCVSLRTRTQPPLPLTLVCCIKPKILNCDVVQFLSRAFDRLILCAPVFSCALRFNPYVSRHQRRRKHNSVVLLPLQRRCFVLGSFHRHACDLTAVSLLNRRRQETTITSPGRRGGRETRSKPTRTTRASGRTPYKSSRMGKRTRISGTPPSSSW